MFINYQMNYKLNNQHFKLKKNIYYYLKIIIIMINDIKILKKY